MEEGEGVQLLRVFITFYAFYGLFCAFYGQDSEERPGGKWVERERLESLQGMPTW